MSEFKGSDLLMKCLAELGVKHIFGMGGHGNLAICDGLYKAKDTYGIQGIIIHDESVGASAAGGYFKATGRPGVLLVTNGPGMMQAIPGVVEQAMSNSPVIVICGDIPTYQAGYGAEEELDICEDMDQASLYRGFAKRVYRVVHAEQIPMTVARAYTTAMSGRPGVVMINIPVDVQAKEISAEDMNRDYRLKEHAIVDRPRGSRAAVDAGYAEHDRQIGQTGVTVRPKLYIACGISGQIQHIAGMQESGIIISINNDPDAPINTIADYVINGTIEEVVPKMIKYYKQNSK